MREGPRAVRISIHALGGQGGGVLSDWIVRAGEKAGYIAQSTSVPGVAQRTGATVYYIELFPEAEARARGKAPVLALMPAPGDVDVLIASEMMEAGRAIARGLVSRRTTLIASSHRVLAVSEKTPLGDGRMSTGAIADAATASAGCVVMADMQEQADAAGSTINAVLLGALSATGALAISRSAFEEAINSSGRASASNLAGFARGVATVTSAAPASKKSPEPPESFAAPSFLEAFPVQASALILEGYHRLVDYQDRRYGDLYLQRLEKIRGLDARIGGDRCGWMLTTLAAKHAALWMSYEDVIRVADLKTRASRFRRIRLDVRATPEQILHVTEFMHPRPEEICDLLPTATAERILASAKARRLFEFFLGGGRRISTSKLRGFLPLYFAARLRPFRRAGYRYAVEQSRIDAWLHLAIGAAPDYDLACEIIRLQRLLKGYGETYERGCRNFTEIVNALPAVRRQRKPAASLKALHEAALVDEGGIALDALLAKLNGSVAATA